MQDFRGAERLQQSDRGDTSRKRYYENQYRDYRNYHRLDIDSRPEYRMSDYLGESYTDEIPGDPAYHRSEQYFSQNQT
jgi:hypothetical protein